MQMAMAVGGAAPGRMPTCCGARWAPSAGWSGSSRCGRSCTRAWPSNGLVGEDADAIYAKIQAFANFGFAESHSLSFGLLVYASSWIKLHYPAAFLAGLLRAQPMGFYSPATLTADARRHGVEVRRPDLLRSSGVGRRSLEPVERVRRAEPVRPERRRGDVPARPTGLQPDRRSRRSEFDRHCARRVTQTHRRDGGLRRAAGLAAVKGIGRDGRRAHRRRARGGTGLPRPARPRPPRRTSPPRSSRRSRPRGRSSASASAGARRSGSPAPPRRTAPSSCPARSSRCSRRCSPIRRATSELAADLWATGVSTDDHPMTHYRVRARRARSAHLERAAHATSPAGASRSRDW